MAPGVAPANDDRLLACAGDAAVIRVEGIALARLRRKCYAPA